MANNNQNSIEKLPASSISKRISESEKKNLKPVNVVEIETPIHPRIEVIKPSAPNRIAAEKMLEQGEARKKPVSDIYDLAYKYIQEFFTYSGEYTEPVMPEIFPTDDIGESAPFVDLVNMVAGQRTARQLGLIPDVSFPFESFDTFDPDIDIHNFKIIYEHRDEDTINQTMDKYQDVMELISATKNIVDLLIYTGANDFNGAMIILRKKIADLRNRGLITGTEAETITNIVTDVEKVGEQYKPELVEIAKVLGKDRKMLGPKQDKNLAAIRERWANDGGIGARLRGNNPIYYITIHGTGGGGTIEWMLNNKDTEKQKHYSRGIGLFHYHIDTKGVIRVLFDPAKYYTAHDDGGRQNLNSIGIELENLVSSKSGNVVVENMGTYTQEQYKSLAWLIGGYLVKKFPKIKEIRSHRYRSQRLTEPQYWPNGNPLQDNLKGKCCPGPNFSWESLTTALSKHYSTIVTASDAFDCLQVNSSVSKKEQDAIAAIDNTLSDAGATGAGLEGTLNKVVISSMYREILTNMFRYIENDLTGKIEELQLTMSPGTSVYIPMQGEQAPVVQSTGGQQCEVTVKLKEVSPVDLAKLSLMFKVPGAVENMTSMLLMARSTFKATDAHDRLKYIVAYAESEQFRNTINLLQGKNISPRLDEPVRITNDVLNSLGYRTFVPTNLEIKTVEEVANAFDVIITFQYINLGNRYLESLKKYKTGYNIPILPMGTRLSSIVDTSDKGYGANDKPELDFIGKLSFLSFRKGLAEILPLYIMSRINQTFEVMKARAGSRLYIDDMLDLLSLTEDRSLWEGESKWDSIEKSINDNNKRGRAIVGDIGDTFNGVTELIASFGLTLLSGKVDAAKVTNTLNTVSANVKDARKTIAAGEKVSEVLKEKGTSAYQRIAESIRAVQTNGKKNTISAVAGVSSITGLLLGSAIADKVTNSENTETSNQQDSTYLHFNLLALVPVYMFDLIRDYTRAVKANQVDNFIYTIAVNAQNLLSQSVSDKIWGLASAQRLELGGDSIHLYREGKNIANVRGAYVYCALVGSNDKGYVVSKDSINSTGIYSLQQKYEEELKKLSGKITASGDDKYAVEQLATYAAMTINYLSVRSIIDIASIRDMLPENDGSRSSVNISVEKMSSEIKEFDKSTTHLMVSNSARVHIAEILSSLVTVSCLDMLASATVMSSDDVLTSSGYIARVNDLKKQIVTRIPDLPNQLTSDESEWFDRAIDGFRVSVQKAKQVMDKSGLNPELISGMLVSNSFTNSELRVGVCNALLYNLGNIEKISSVSPDTQSAKFPTIFDIVSQIEQSYLVTASNIIRASWNSVARAFLDTFGFIVANMSVSFLKQTAKGIFLRVLAGFANCIVLVYSLAGVIASVIGPKVIGVVIGHMNMLILSQWLAQRVKEGIDQSTLIELCLESRIWFPDVLDYGVDILDNRTTSYVDYPAVLYQGKPLMPDLFIYKIGFTQESFHAMKNNISEITAVVEEKAKRLDSTDFGAIMKELNARLSDSKNIILRDTELELEAIVTGLTARSSYLFNSGDGFSKLDSRDTRNEAYTIVQIANMINDVMSVGDTSSVFNTNGSTPFLYMEIIKSSDSSIIAASKPTKEKYGLKLSIDDNGKCSLVPHKKYFWDFAKKNNNGNLVSENNPKIKDFVSKIDDGKYSGQAARRFMQKILEVTESLVTHQRNIVSNISEMPDTINNMLLAKYLVGSNMRTIGRPGINIMKGQVRELGFQSIQKAVSFASGYLYPTVKLFFIEEDNEAYYMFDDLYSYASIVSFTVHGHRTMATQTLQLQVTNVYGRLDDVVADQYNMETNFIHDPKQEAPINSLMLRIGCKIKVQAGNTPLLTERNTVFTGRITSITPGPITTIEAQSGGDVLTEDISTNQVKIYGSSAALSTNMLKRSYAMIANTILSMNPLGGNNYMRPVENIKNIIGYVLQDITVESSLDDYTMVPEMQTHFDGELKISTPKLTQAIKDKLFPNVMNFMTKAAGADIKFGINNQLFENIYVDGDQTMSRHMIPGLPIGDGAWISSMENAWECLNEINLLLPNNMLTVRPYDTRSTLVWANQDGYYRFRRKTDMNSAITSSVIKKVDNFRKSQGKFEAFIKNYENAQQSKNKEQLAGAISLLTIIAYHAQRIYDMYQGGNNHLNMLIDPQDIVTFENKASVKKALYWLFAFPISNVQRSISATINHHNAVFEAYRDAMPKKNSKLSEGEFDIKIDDIVKMARTHVQFNAIDTKGSIDEVIRCLIIKHLALEYASEFYTDLLANEAYSRSTSHRRVSDYHIKLSGRDIVSNDISLLEPYNTVKIAFPKAGEGDPDEIVKESVDRNEYSVPIHCKLKPWAVKAYSTYFKNANVFPLGYTSVISMAAISVLSNLMKETYGGTITLLGDPTIHPGDRMLIWDENRDLFGLIGVRSHTFIFDQQQGCLSVIEPDLLTKNEYMLERGAIDSFLWLLESLENAILVGGVTYAAYRGLKKGIQSAKSGALRRLFNTMGIAKTGRMTNKLINSSYEALFQRGSIFETLFKKGGILSKVMKIQDGKWLNETLESLVKSKTEFETVVASEKLASDILMDMSTNLKDVNQIERLSLNEVREAIAKTLGKIFKNGTSPRSSKEIIESVRYHGNKNIIDLLENKFGSLSEGEKQVVSMITDKHLEGESIEHAAKNLIDGAKVTIPDENILRNAGLSKDDCLKAIERMQTDTIFNETPFMDIVSKSWWFTGVLGGLTLGSGLVREISEFCLINDVVADQVAIIPLFFRGEPYVAGLEGVEKGDAENAGLVDVMKARFSQFGEVLEHAVTDKYQETLYNFIRKYNRVQGEYKTE